MRLITLARPDGTASVGVLEGETVADIGSSFPSMLVLIGHGEAGLDRARGLAEAAQARGDVVKLADVSLRAPVPRPARIRAYSTYRAHAEGCGMTPPPAFDVMPLGYKGNPLAVSGPDDPIRWPAYTDQLDFELELGFYIGLGGMDIPVSEARRHVAGVTVYNDVSARDIQVFEMSMGTGPAKGKDFCNVMGPCLVTLDEFQPERDHDAWARVNGEEWVKTTTGGAQFSIEELVAWASYGEPLVAGDFVSLGTMGRGCCFELGRWIEPGDVVELEIDGIGVLRNPVGGRETAAPGSGLPQYRIPQRVGRTG